MIILGGSEFSNTSCLQNSLDKQGRSRVFPVCFSDKQFVNSSPDCLHLLRTERKKLLKFPQFKDLLTISTTSTSACIRSWYINVCKSFFICIVLSSSSDSVLSNLCSHRLTSHYAFTHLGMGVMKTVPIQRKSDVEEMLFHAIRDFY